jgi:hypothetical protein
MQSHSEMLWWGGSAEVQELFPPLCPSGVLYDHVSASSQVRRRPTTTGSTVARYVYGMASLGLAVTRERFEASNAKTGTAEQQQNDRAIGRKAAEVLNPLARLSLRSSNPHLQRQTGARSVNPLAMMCCQLRNEGFTQSPRPRAATTMDENPSVASGSDRRSSRDFRSRFKQDVRECTQMGFG